MATTTLSAVFKAVDNMSAVMDKMADSGTKMTESWDKAGKVVNGALTDIASGASQSAGVIGEAVASQVAAVGDFDKAATGLIQNKAALMATGQLASEEMGKWTTAARDGAQAGNELATALEGALKRQEPLTQSETEAKKALEELFAAMRDGGTHLEKLQSKVEDVDKAFKVINVAVAVKETGLLTKASELASKAVEFFGNKTGKAITGISQIFKQMGVTKLFTDLTDKVIAMANVFSESQSVLIKASGASGTALDGLTSSMMSLYGSANGDSLSSVAGAIGEVNRQLGLTGPELENVTGLFLDYSRVTGSTVGNSVQKMNKVMNGWNLEAEDSERLMDKLVYASQSSGISVDKLSDSLSTNANVLQQSGFKMEDSIALLSVLEQNSIDVSSVMGGLNSAVAGFSENGEDAAAAIQSTIAEIAAMGDTSEATALAIQIFGDAGKDLVGVIQGGQLDEWTQSIKRSQGTLASTAEAATTLKQKWAQATNSLSAAFSSVLSPTVEAISSALAGVVQWVGDLLNRFPLLTAVLVAVAAAIGAVVIGAAAFTAASGIATAVTGALSTAMAALGIAVNASLWPLVAVAAAIGAVVAVAGFFIGKMSEEKKAYNELSATGKQHHDRMKELNAEYEEAVAKHTELSEEAQNLAIEIAAEEAKFEAASKTMAEFRAGCDAVIERHDSLIESFESSNKAINDEENTAMNLIAKLDQLSLAGDDVEGSQQQMEAIVSKLNKEYPGLSASIDETTGALNMSTDAIRDFAAAQAEGQRIAQRYETYLDLVDEVVDLEYMHKDALAQVAAAEKNLENASGWNRFRAKDELEEYKDALEQVEKRVEDANQRLEEMADSAAYDQWATNLQSSAERAGTAVDNLNTVWDEQYESSRKSIQGQIGLFKELNGEMDVSVDKMLETWNSHTEHMLNYAENIKSAEGIFDEGLVQSLSDGSEESAAYLAAIMEGYEKALAAGSEEAAAYQNEINESFREREAAADELAKAITDTSSEVKAATVEAEEAMAAFTESMKMSDEVSEYGGEAALAFLNSFSEQYENIQEAFNNVGKQTEELDKADEAEGYGESIGAQLASGLASQQGPVATAAKKLFSGISNSLTGQTIKISASLVGSGVEGLAKGTLSAAPGLTLVGEEGPELVNFGGGEAVYTAAETKRILMNGGQAVQTSVPDSFVSARGDVEATKSTVEKKITLDINGSGELAVGGKRDEETIWGILSTQIKPVLMGLIKQEILEEGDLAYEF